jgi:uncharacterized protein (TIGR03067 family)
MKSTMMVALAALFLLGAQASNKSDKAKSDPRAKRYQERWQGNWKLTSKVVDGKPAPAAETKDAQLTVKGDGYTFKNGDFLEHGTYKFHDVSKDPRQVDIVVADGKDKGKVYLAVFSMDKDTTLRLCFETANKTRPRHMIAAAGSGLTLEVWDKVK